MKKNVGISLVSLLMSFQMYGQSIVASNPDEVKVSAGLSLGYVDGGCYYPSSDRIEDPFVDAKTLAILKINLIKVAQRECNGGEARDMEKQIVEAKSAVKVEKYKTCSSHGYSFDSFALHEYLQAESLYTCLTNIANKK